MRNLIISIINILLILILISLLTSHWYRLNFSKDRKVSAYADIDDLRNVMDKIKKVTSDNSLITYYTNRNYPKSVELYYETEFLLAPRVLTRQIEQNDTILLINDLTLKNLISMDHADTILAGKTDRFSITLLKKKPSFYEFFPYNF